MYHRNKILNHLVETRNVNIETLLLVLIACPLREINTRIIIVC